MIAAQRDFLVLEIIIGVTRADGAHRHFHLGGDEAAIIINVEQRLRRIGNAPHQLRGDLDRVAAQIVDLDLLRNQVVGAQADLLLAHPRPGPAQAIHPIGAAIGTKQGDGCALVGLQHVEAADDKQEGQQQQRQPDHDHRRAAGQQRQYPEQAGGQDDQQQKQHGNAIAANASAFKAGLAGRIVSGHLAFLDINAIS